jgi:hypothetical protein
VKPLNAFGRNFLLFIAYDANGTIIAGGYPEYFVVVDERGRMMRLSRPPGHKRDAIARLLPTRSQILMVTSNGLVGTDSLGSPHESFVAQIKYYGSAYTDGYFEYACNADGSLLAHADGAGVCVQCLNKFHGIDVGSQFFVWPGDWHRMSLRFGSGDRLFVAHLIENRVELLCFTPTLAGRPIR